MLPPVKRVVIKLGSSVVAEDSGGLRADALERVCGVVMAAHAADVDIVLVSSGAVARGMQALGLEGRPGTIDALQATSAVGQGKVYRVYDEILQSGGVVSAQVLLTFMDMSSRAHYLNARQTLRKLLDWRVVPVINENDTTTTDEISFGDNDFLAAQVAILVSADLLVLLTDVEGVYSADPRIDAEARLVEEIYDLAILEDLEIGSTKSLLGSGGMRSKVIAAGMATAAGIPSIVCSGLRDGALQAAIDGHQVGTRFPPRKARHSSFKLWLRYAKPSLGTIIVDAGAARALRREGSLLPVGIVEVAGHFQAGDAVDIAVRDGDGLRAQRRIAKGICNYSAEELRRVKGLKSGIVREIVPRATEEAVHRDYMVID